MPGAAIFHHPDAVESADKPLAGRRTAGQSFLAGLARFGQGERLTCAAANRDHIGHFRDLVTGYGWQGQIAGRLLTRPQDIAADGVLQLPGPGLASYAWPRRRVGQTAYSLCGITHTVATRRIVDGLQAMLSAPVEEWDAVICTSQAVRSVVATELDAAEAFLRQRFAARRVPRPQLPVVPLGIDTATFAHRDEDRARWRAELGIGADEIAVLSMGRLATFEKMHPAPALIALERAAQETGAKLTFLMVGWFADEREEALHREAAAAFAPSVRVLFPDGRDADLRYSIWSAADVFLFPVDNIQETFGLAPVEAMAAGLPVVCSDWNGFRDTVEHGVTGFRVRTLMSRPGSGRVLAERYEDRVDNYHQHLGFVHQRTMVDIAEMAEALVALIRSPEKRAEMGAAGVARAQRLYDWAAVIPQFEAVWADLGARRARALSVQEHGGADANPASIDPFRLYAGYPSAAISGHSVLSAAEPVTAERVEDLMQLTGARQIKRMVARAEDVVAVSEAVARHGPVTLDDLAPHVSMSETAREGAVLWLAKFGLMEIAT